MHANCTGARGRGTNYSRQDAGIVKEGNRTNQPTFSTSLRSIHVTIFGWCRRATSLVEGVARLLLSGSRPLRPRSRRRMPPPIDSGGEERGPELAVLRRPRRRSCWRLSPPFVRRGENEMRETGRCAQLRGSPQRDVAYSGRPWRMRNRGFRRVRWPGR